MSAAPFILFSDPDGWRVGRLVADEVSVSDVIAPADAPTDVLAAALRAAGVARRPVLLAVPSATCLCASIPVSDLPAKHRRQAMLYRLEERLPVSAEDVVADFVADAGGAGALGVCVQRRPLESLLGRLRAGGVKVGAICPTGLLALQHFVNAGGGDAGAADALVVWSDAPHTEVFAVGGGGTPRAWSVVPDEPDDVALPARMHLLGAARRPRVVTCGVRAEVLERLRSTTGGDLDEVPAVPMRHAAALAGRLILAGTIAAWVDLAPAHAGAATASSRALAQARGPLAWLAACAGVLALGVVAALFVRAARYERLAEAYESRQREVYRRAFPGQSVPRDVRSRLASEAQRLQTAAGAAGVTGSPDGSSAAAAERLLVLRDVIAGLPADLRLRVTELRVEPGRFELQGEARSHGDAEAIAEALRNADGVAGRGFEVEPPRTEFRAAGQFVAFTLTGVASPQAPGAASARAAVSASGGGGE